LALQEESVMAIETTDYAAVLEFIHRAKLRHCYLPTPGAPPQFQDERQLLDLILYLGLGLKTEPPAGEPPAARAFAAGWTSLEGVMLLQPEPEFDADWRASLTATSERALRDLLLAFPPGQVGFFYISARWMLPVLSELFEGREMPAREGYYATAASFVPHLTPPARRIGAEEYPLVQAHWSESVWEQMRADGYAVHGCLPDAQLQALCFHWPVAPWRREVHGLRAVRQWSAPGAASAVSSATEEVVGEGKVATCTANLANETDYLNAFRAVGYQSFHRIHSFLGIKRGSGTLGNVDLGRFFGHPSAARTQAASQPGEGAVIGTSKDPVLAQFRDLAQAAGRRERMQFVIEGLTLVQRAIHDGLPVDALVYTPDLLRASEGVGLLRQARVAGIAHYRMTEGLMGRLTTTRPVPPVLAAVFFACRGVARVTAVGSSLLLAERVSNPDNLGMILRTADAAGVDGVVVLGESSDPFHKHCVRAARGAVGRIPILCCSDPEAYLSELRRSAFRIVGATARAETALYHCVLRPPVAIIVGNEQSGISPPVLAACTELVRIPMAPGQDSLNVGVASGVLLYELLRQRMADSAPLR
jgi:tRNA G18 (ribose-2'-O)-methylase SpoU